MKPGSPPVAADLASHLACRPFLTLGIALFCFARLFAAAAEPQRDILYKDGTSLTAYEQERCRLDLYLPAGTRDFPTLVWFHGGGLDSGRKDDDVTRGVAASLARGGVAVVAANYRLISRAAYPACAEDAAAAVAWTLRHIAGHGGDPRDVFVGGHSAGGYLAALVGLNPRFLSAHQLRRDAVAGIVSFSGQMMTHYALRPQRGLEKFNVVADDAAPIHFCRRDTPPMLLFYAGKDMPTRKEENAFFVATMAAAGNTRVQGMLLEARNHHSIAANVAADEDEARVALLQFVRIHSASR